MEVPTSDTVREACNLPVQYYLGRGVIVWGVYKLDNDVVLKIYKGNNIGVGRLPELDLTSRLVHPGIVKTIKVLTREACPSIDLNHGLIMEYVPGETVEDNLFTRLRSFNMAMSAAALLYKNGVVHHDWSIGNQFPTSQGYIIIDLNYEETENPDPEYHYEDVKKAYFRILRGIISPGNWLEFYNYGNKKNAPIPNNIVMRIPMTDWENKLLYDLVLRLLSKDVNTFMYFDEIPWHPLLRLYNLPHIESNYKPRIIINGDFPAKYQDHRAVWDVILNRPEWTDQDTNQYNIFVMECMDMYYRFLPFVVNENLIHVAEQCIWLLYRLRPSYFNIPSSLVNDTLLEDKIIRSLNGQLRDINFYHGSMTTNDITNCWKLMYLPYDQYMNINKDRFHEIVPPYDDVETETLIEGMMMPTVNNTNYVFHRLTQDEALEFIHLYNVPYVSVDRHEDTLMCERIFKYVYANYGSQAPITWAISDLIISSNITLNATQQYKLKDLESISPEITATFANLFGLDINAENVKERIIRILRMNYLIEL